MSGAISSLPQYALMAWCSLKAQGQLYLYLLIKTNCVILHHMEESNPTRKYSHHLHDVQAGSDISSLY
jgi:hypothetical protein